MHGTIILCTQHHQVHNASTRQWQEVSQEVFDELTAMAQEIDDVVIWEGACERCVDAAAASFRALNSQRYTEAMTRELGYDVRPAYGAEDE